jgi:hypothetical protein
VQRPTVRFLIGLTRSRSRRPWITEFVPLRAPRIGFATAKIPSAWNPSAGPCTTGKPEGPGPRHYLTLSPRKVFSLPRAEMIRAEVYGTGLVRPANGVLKPGASYLWHGMSAVQMSANGLRMTPHLTTTPCLPSTVDTLCWPPYDRATDHTDICCDPGRTLRPFVACVPRKGSGSAAY